MWPACSPSCRSPGSTPFPYNARAKPIERFFGTLELGFGKRFTTYCGNKPDNRPEVLQSHLDKGEAPDAGRVFPALLRVA